MVLKVSGGLAKGVAWSRGRGRQDADRTSDRTELLIAELQDRARSLEEANRENRRIIAALTSRIPAIEAPADERDEPETVETETERAERRSAAPDPQTGAERRPRWRRIVGR